MVKNADFNKESLPIESANEIIDAYSKRLAQKYDKLEQILSHTLAEEIVAEINVPNFRRSAVDGYALRYVDFANRKKNEQIVKVSDTIYAGESVERSLEKDEVLKIMTGAPVPNGADVVVPIEDVQKLGSHSVEIVKLPFPSDGSSNIRDKGEDIKVGDRLFCTGQKITVPMIGVLASIGRQFVKVYPKPKIAIIHTGNEVVSVGEPLNHGQIYNTNFYLLSSLYKKFGAKIIINMSVDDTLEAVVRALKLAAMDADIVVTTGGVSVGDKDFVKEALNKVGRMLFWRIKVKPGGPMVFGTIGDSQRETVFFGLPGNPVSAYITSMLFVRRSINRMQNQPLKCLTTVKARLIGSINNSDGRKVYARAKFIKRDGIQYAQILNNQSSGSLFPVAEANCYVICPAGIKRIKNENSVDVVFFEDD